MKKLLIAAVAALALASAAAYAQMQHQGGMHGTPPAAGSPGPHGQGMHGGMHGRHGGMHGGMHGGQHSSHGQHGEVKGDNSPSSLAFHGINAKMHKGMDIAFTGNTDVDFVKGMIPHHEGAVDMAKVVLAFGKDPEIKALAESIIKAQETEIAQMKAWLARNAR
jgi:opacity protein-like surface antigen